MPRRKGFKFWSRIERRRPCQAAGEGSRSARGRARPFPRAAVARSRQDPRRRRCGNPRGGGFLPLLCARSSSNHSANRSPCRDRPARTTASSIAAAASSSASRRGTSRWRFSPGRSSAALAAGNAVVAKPAEQTPLVAHEAVQLLHEAGVPKDALLFVPGDGACRRGADLASEDRRRLPSPARPKPPGRSTGRWRPRTGRSCR